MSPATAKTCEAQILMDDRSILEERIGVLQRNGEKTDARMNRFEEKLEAVKDSVTALRVEVMAAIGALRAEINQVRADLTKETNSVRVEVASLRTEIHSVRTEIKQATITLIKWMIGLVLATASLAFGLALGVAKYVH